MLLKGDDDPRISKIEIPIVDNKFEYTLNCDDEENYELIFKDEYEKGSMMPIAFFSENANVSFQLYPEDRHNENIIKGGNLNQENVRYEQVVDSVFNFTKLEAERNLLDDSYKFLSAKAYATLEAIENNRDSLIQIMRELESTGETYSEKGKALNAKFGKFIVDRTNWQLEYLRSSKPSIVNYSKLVAIKSNDKDNKNTDACFAIFNDIYRKVYPNHPYTKRMNTEYLSHTQMKVGGKYIDFENPSFEGENTKLSEHITGKVALIDLWALWCGPCRRNSIQIKPIYEAYKDKGFTVVGVAREEKAEYAINAAKKDGYPWLNLLEIKDRNQIWVKYGIANSGGSTFLVDTDGTILAISPTPEEVERILKEKLGDI